MTRPNLHRVRTVTRTALVLMAIGGCAISGCAGTAPDGADAPRSDACAAANRRIELARSDPERQLAILDAAEACRDARAPGATSATN